MSHSNDKYSRDLGHLKSKYLPGAKKSSYYKNYDNIKWNSKPNPDIVIIYGKIRKNTTAENLFIKESVNAARTPILERKGITGEKSFPVY